MGTNAVRSMSGVQLRVKQTRQNRAPSTPRPDKLLRDSLLPTMSRGLSVPTRLRIHASRADMFGFGKTVHTAIEKLHEVYSDAAPTADQAAEFARRVFHLKHVQPSRIPRTIPDRTSDPVETDGRWLFELCGQRISIPAFRCRILHCERSATRAAIRCVETAFNVGLRKTVL